jgi:hypothetical protein
MEGMMNRICIVICAGVLLAGCRNSLPAQEISGSGDVAAADPFLYDFGRIPASTPVVHEFILTNNGTREIHVGGLTNSCGCTGSEINKKTIPAGDSAAVKVTFNPKGYKGSIHQFVYVNTDDPDNPAYRFSIQAYVE